MMHQLVDRILRQQKAEREGAEKEAEKARAEARVSLISNSSEKTLQDTQTKIRTPQMKNPPPPTGTAVAAPPPGKSRKYRS